MSARRDKTIKSTSDLARHLRLSRWTVSRVINGHPEVREETRQKVLQAMKALNFSPSWFARGLRGGRTKTVGVCFREVEDPILVRKIGRLQSLLRHHGYRTLIELTEGDSQVESDIVRHFASLKVEGIIMVGFTNGGTSLKLLREIGIPVVLVDPDIHSVKLPTLELDRTKAMRLILEYLLDLGHRKFALIGISPEAPYGQTRLEAISSFAKEYCLSFEKDFEIFVDPDPQEYGYAYGKLLAEQLIERGTDATSLIALDDLIALGVMQRLQEEGYTIPGDFSIIGFDNIDITEYTTPRLSTVDQQVGRMIESAVDLLLSRIGKTQSSEGYVRFQVNPELVIRESTAPPK